MSKLSKRDSTLLIVIGLVAVLGGLFWFYVKPARADLSATKTQAEEAQGRVDQLQTELAKFTAVAKKPGGGPSLADELRLAKAYPYSQDIPITILQFEDVAKQANVDLGAVTPDGGTDYAGVTGTAFTLSVTGKYFDVQDFIYRLHNRVAVSPAGKLQIKGRLFAVTKADLSPQASDDISTTTATTDVEANITAVAFSRTPGLGAAGAAGDPATQAPAGTDNGGTQS